jgi:hypothetical protein
LECEREHLEHAKDQAETLYKQGKATEAIAVLEVATQIASRHNRPSYEVEGFRKAAAALREEHQMHQRELASVRKSCELVGEANDLLPGAPEQHVWFCVYTPESSDSYGFEVLDIVVEDGNRILSRATLMWDGGNGVTPLRAKGALIDVTGTEEPELLVERLDECRVKTIEVMDWGEDGELRTIWTLGVGLPGDYCGSGDDYIDYGAQDWWPRSMGRPSSPKIELADGRFLWAGESMVWVEESQSFVPSRAGLDRYREQEIARARKLLAKGLPAVAHAILPDDAPAELVREIAASCEKVFLKALSNAKPINEMGKKANPAEARALKADMLGIGLACAPDSQALKRRLKPLQAQIKVDRERSARQAEKQARAERIERFQRQSIGHVKFGMTRAEARKACLERNGSWDSGSSLGACESRSGVTHAAGFCGSRVCSLYITNPWPFSSGKVGYGRIVSYFERRFGEGERSSAGVTEVVRWKLDAQRSIKVTLGRIRGRDLLSVALHSKGER